MTSQETLISGARAFDIRLDNAQADACLVYLAELVKWNRKINLTAIGEEQEIVIKHFLDSFSYAKGFEPLPGTKLLDMGSGAGFPALPLKIAFPDLLITLVESVGKKAAFLRHIIRTLHMTDVDVKEGRTKALSSVHQQKYDVVTARAFAKMETALKEGSRFLKPKGVLVLSRGPAEAIGDRHASAQDLIVEDRIELALPFSGDRRAIWVFRKKA